jgi:MscS family membrane protein
MKDNMLTRIIYVALFSFAFFSPSIGQNNSPYDCIYNHLFYLQPSSYEPFQSAKSFEGNDSLINKKYAIKLKQTLDGLGLFVSIEGLSTEVNYFDTLRQSTRYYLFPNELPEIYVSKIDDKWVYPYEIRNQIDKAHAKLYPFGTKFLINLLPSQTHVKWLGLFLWQWLGMLLLFIVAGIVFYLLSLVIFSIIKVASRSQLSLLQNKAKLLSRLSTFSSLFVTLQVFRLFLPLLQLSPEVSWFAIMILKIISAFVILLIILRVIDVLAGYLHSLAQKTTSKMDEQLLPVVKRIIQIILISFWLIYLLTLFRVDVTALLAGISIGGVAIALAAQDTLRNLFGSFTIFMDKPFQIGDWIQMDDVEGTVEEVGFRSTRVRSFENSLLSVPNAKLMDANVNNYGLRRYRRYKTNISISYDTPPDKIELFVQGLRDIISLHPSSRKDAAEVHLNHMSSSSLDILFYMFFDVSTWTEELKARQEIILGILRLAKDLGIEFAFPSVSVYTGSGTGSFLADKSTLEKSLEDYQNRINRI